MYLPIHTGNTLAANGVVTTVSPISSVNGMLTTYYTPINPASSNFCGQFFFRYFTFVFFNFSKLYNFLGV